MSRREGGLIASLRGLGELARQRPRLYELLRDEELTNICGAVVGLDSLVPIVLDHAYMALIQAAVHAQSYFAGGRPTTTRQLCLASAGVYVTFYPVDPPGGTYGDGALVAFAAMDQLIAKNRFTAAWESAPPTDMVEAPQEYAVREVSHWIEHRVEPPPVTWGDWAHALLSVIRRRPTQTGEG